VGLHQPFESERVARAGPEHLPDRIRADFYTELKEGRLVNISAIHEPWWTRAPFTDLFARDRGLRDLSQLPDELLVWNGCREDGFAWAQDAREVQPLELCSFADRSVSIAY
jgi:hypothetical protein